MFSCELQEIFWNNLSWNTCGIYFYKPPTSQYLLRRFALFYSILFFSHTFLFLAGVLINMAQDNSGYQQLSGETYVYIERGQGIREEARLKTSTENNINLPKQPVFLEKITSFHKATTLFFFFGTIFICVIPGLVSLVLSLQYSTQCSHHNHSVYIMQIYGTLCLVALVCFIHLQACSKSKSADGLLILMLLLSITAELLFIIELVNLKSNKTKDTIRVTESKLTQNCTYQMLLYLKALTAIGFIQIFFVTLFAAFGANKKDALSQRILN